MMSPHLSANFIDSWPIEFVDPPRDKAGKAIFSALREIEFPLCDGALIRKDEHGKFWIEWSHKHPELGDCREYFGKRGSSEPLTEVERIEWQTLSRALPERDFEREISRAEACALFMYFSSLPDEFLPEIEAILSRA
jgi:hypothetical protein